jgi:hypothetical protein
VGRARTTEPLSDAALSRWCLIADFQQRLEKQLKGTPAAGTWSDPQRRLQISEYLSLFLLGLFNPVVKTMRGLCAASHLPRVQKEVCSRRVSLGSFSEAQALVEIQLLQNIFTDLSREVLGSPSPAGEGVRTSRRWLIQDSSLFEALPRMHWALWRRQGKTQAQVRLHVSLDLESQAPARASLTPGKVCERKEWKQTLRSGDAVIGDRYYGEDYGLLGELEQKGVAFVVRLREQAVINMQEELALSLADRTAAVIQNAWVKLGCKKCHESGRLRLVRVQTPKEVLLLVTNLKPEELSAAEVALLYKERWRIELFFRWIKCILGCRHWLAESPQGAALQIYLALIAALLLQLYTGERPSRRLMELLQFYTMGWASLEDVMAGVQREAARKARRKKE